MKKTLLYLVSFLLLSTAGAMGNELYWFGQEGDNWSNAKWSANGNGDDLDTWETHQGTIANLRDFNGVIPLDMDVNLKGLTGADKVTIEIAQGKILTTTAVFEFSGKFSGEGIIQINENLTLLGESPDFEGTVNLPEGKSLYFKADNALGTGTLEWTAVGDGGLYIEYKENETERIVSNAINVTQSLNWNIPEGKTVVYKGVINNMSSINGGGKMVLEAANTFGSLALNDNSYLVLNHAEALGEASNTLTSNGGFLTIKNGLTIPNGIILSGTLSLDTPENESVTLSGNISGDGIFTKTGLGALTVSGDLENTGGTVINGGNLVMSQTGNMEYSGFSGNGILQKTGTGELTLKGDNSLGGIGVTAGKLIIDKESTITISGDINIADDGALVDNTGTIRDIQFDGKAVKIEEIGQSGSIPGSGVTLKATITYDETISPAPTNNDISWEKWNEATSMWATYPSTPPSPVPPLRADATVDAEITVDEIGKYRAVLTINGTVFYSAQAEVKATSPSIYHTVTLEIPDAGISITEGAQAGKNTVEKGDFLSFTFVVAPDSLDYILKVTVDGNEVKPYEKGNGAYVLTVTDVQKDTTIKITLEKDDDPGNGNVDINELATQVYSADGCLFVITAIPQPITVYNITGALKANLTATSTEATIPLPNGIYLVKVGKEVFKTIVK